jgi:hypothetical protein
VTQIQRRFRAKKIREKEKLLNSIMANKEDLKKVQLIQNTYKSKKNKSPLKTKTSDSTKKVILSKLQPKKVSLESAVITI